MKTFARTKDRNDLYLDSTGQIAMCEGYDFYAQEIEAAILTVQGEIQLDVTLGIPYFTTIFDSRRYLSQWSSAVRNRIANMPFRTVMQSFETEFRGASLIYSATILCGEEGTVVSVSNSINAQLVIPDGQGGIVQMESLTDDNGNFYLPVQKVGGIQHYRMLTVFKDPQFGDSTQVSAQTYIKDQNGDFVVVNQ